jgi:magnesium-protoporphyrin IX monomethyl ester (oxidative) cyclase
LFSNRATEAAELAKAIKENYPGCPIIMGGQHPSGIPEAIIASEDVDYVLTGECDTSIVLLLNSLNGRFPMDQVPSLYYKQDGQVLNTLSGNKPAVQGDGWQYLLRDDSPNPANLNELSFPAWHLFPMEAYWDAEVRVGGGDVMKERYAVMVSTRGCPWTCDFCTSPLMGGFKGYRRRTNEEVVAEIRWLADEFGVEEIKFLDDNFFVSKPRVKSLLKVLAEEFKDMVFSVPSGTEVNALDAETIGLMAKANFYRVTLAIEAGDQEVQEARISKNVKIDRLGEITRLIKESGMETHALFMIGFPDETRAQIMKTVALAKSLVVDDFYFSVVTPLPGTPLYDECVRRDLLYDDFDVNNIRYSVANIKLPDMSREELEGLRRSVWLEKKAEMAESQPDNKESTYRQFEDSTEYEFAGWKKLPSDFKEE